MKKTLFIILAVMLVCSPIFASGAKEAESDSPTITYVTLGDTGMSLLEQAAKDFEAKTGIKVKLESWAYSDAYQKVLTLAGGNNLPDAMYGFSSWIPEFKEAGYTVAVDELISKALYDDFSKASREVCSLDGKLWALPSYMSIRGMLFNTKAFSKAGVAIPTTWMEYLKVAPKLTDPKNNKYAYTMVAGHPKNTIDTFLPLLWAYDASIVSSDGKKNGFNNPNGVAALQMYTDMAAYAVPDYGQGNINSTQHNFTTQVAAGYFHNAQGLAALKDAGEDYSWAEITPPLAGPRGTSAALGIMDVDLVFNTGKQDMAAQWLEFWHHADREGRVIEEAGWVPNQQSFYARPAFTDPKNVFVAPFANMEPSAKFKPSILRWAEVEKVLADAVSKAVMKTLTPKEALAIAGDQVDKLLAK